MNPMLQSHQFHQTICHSNSREIILTSWRKLFVEIHIHSVGFSTPDPGTAEEKPLSGGSYYSWSSGQLSGFATGKMNSRLQLDTSGDATKPLSETYRVQTLVEATHQSQLYRGVTYFT